MKINNTISKGKPNICDTCKTKRKPEELNYEAEIHHGATKLECIDMKACERRKRKLK